MGIGHRPVWYFAALLETWGLKLAPNDENANIHRALGELTAEVRGLRRESAQAATAADQDGNTVILEGMLYVRDVEPQP